MSGVHPYYGHAPRILTARYGQGLHFSKIGWDGACPTGVVAEYPDSPCPYGTPTPLEPNYWVVPQPAALDPRILLTHFYAIRAKFLGSRIANSYHDPRSNLPATNAPAVDPYITNMALNMVFAALLGPADNSAVGGQGSTESDQTHTTLTPVCAAPAGDGKGGYQPNVVSGHRPIGLTIVAVGGVAQEESVFLHNSTRLGGQGLAEATPFYRANLEMRAELDALLGSSGEDSPHFSSM